MLKLARCGIADSSSTVLCTKYICCIYDAIIAYINKDPGSSGHFLSKNSGFEGPKFGQPLSQNSGFQAIWTAGLSANSGFEGATEQKMFEASPKARISFLVRKQAPSAKGSMGCLWTVLCCQILNSRAASFLGSVTC